MIHTLNYYFDLAELNEEHSEDIITYLEKNNNKKYYEDYGITISREAKNKYRKLIYIRVDLTILLNTFDIKNHHYQETIDKLDLFLENELAISYSKFTLIRIDYRFDVKLDKEIRKFFLKLYRRKVIKKYGFKKKNKKKEHKTTMYMNNKSVSMIVYDKEEERKDKNRKIKKEEKDVLRFEVAVKNNHLNYQKRNGLVKDLLNYFNQSMKEIYFDKNFNKILYSGDYYKIYEARKILKKKVHKEKLRKNIDNFLVEISNSSISTVKENYSKYYFNKYIKKLEELNINPMLIPKNAELPSMIKHPFNRD